MPAQSWTTAAQRVFLEGLMPNYLRLKAEKSSSQSIRDMSAFLKKVPEDFWVLWPEVDSLVAKDIIPPSCASKPKSTWTKDEIATHERALDSRREQIKSWFRTHARTAVGLNRVAKKGSTRALSSLIAPPGKKRLHKAVEMYSLKYYETKLRSLVEAEFVRRGIQGSSGDQAIEDVSYDLQNGLDDLGEGSMAVSTEGGRTLRSLRFSASREIVQEAWNNESPEVRQSIFRALEVEKEEMLNTLDTSKEGLDRDPEQRKFVIGNLVSLLENVCEEVRRLTGWSTLVVTGGPNPSFDEIITIQTVSVGWTAQSDLGFPTVYTDYKRNITEPYLAFLSQVYPNSSKTMQALDSPASRETDTLLAGESNKPDHVLAGDNSIPDTSITVGTNSNMWSGPFSDDDRLFDDIPGRGPLIQEQNSTLSWTDTRSAPNTTTPVSRAAGDEFIFPQNMFGIGTTFAPETTQNNHFPFTLPIVQPLEGFTSMPASSALTSEIPQDLIIERRSTTPQSSPTSGHTVVFPQDMLGISTTLAPVTTQEDQSPFTSMPASSALAFEVPQDRIIETAYTTQPTNPTFACTGTALIPAPGTPPITFASQTVEGGIVTSSVDAVTTQPMDGTAPTSPSPTSPSSVASEIPSLTHPHAESNLISAPVTPPITSATNTIDLPITSVPVASPFPVTRPPVNPLPAMTSVPVNSSFPVTRPPVNPLPLNDKTNHGSQEVNRGRGRGRGRNRRGGSGNELIVEEKAAEPDQMQVIDEGHQRRGENQVSTQEDHVEEPIVIVTRPKRATVPSKYPDGSVMPVGLADLSNGTTTKRKSTGGLQEPKGKRIKA
ncbi:hypothetical protein H0H93_000485 [Arthromyces matolae]|nr:hypothetical protein H0H93_000485 [Arthromyces matolae]